MNSDVEGHDINSSAHTEPKGTHDDSEIEEVPSPQSPQWLAYHINQNHSFHIPERYSLRRAIGQGAFGVVCAAKVRSDGSRVAIKKVVIQQDNILEVKRLVREVHLLAHFHHERIISLFDIIEPQPNEPFNEIYLVTDLMDIDLHAAIREQPLSDKHVSFFIWQILAGLKAIHSANVLHRDLKPSNIVVNANCDLKICDFGLAREQDADDSMTTYVATRWYRAPELVMERTNYSPGVDIWSAGCILAELLTKRPLFQGKNFVDQLNKIIAIIGTPTPEEIEGMGSEQARKYLKGLEVCEKADFGTLFPDANPDAIDLLKQMLQFDPAKRPTAEQCLEHPYLAAVHDPEDEPSSTPFKIPLDMSSPTLTILDLKKSLWDKIAEFHPEHAGKRFWTDAEQEDSDLQKEDILKEMELRAASAAG